MVKAILYHNVIDDGKFTGENANKGWTQKSRFGLAISWIQQIGARFITADQFALRDFNDCGSNIILTFDDGAISVFDYILPTLKDQGIKATIFIHTACQDDKAASRRLTNVSWEQVRKLAAEGWTIGSHSVSHAKLTTISFADLERELTVSKDRIEAETGRECQHLATPYGAYDEPTVARIAQHYKYHWTCDKQIDLNGGDPLHLGRWNMNNAELSRVIGIIERNER